MQPHAPTTDYPAWAAIVEINGTFGRIVARTFGDNAHYDVRLQDGRIVRGLTPDQIKEG